MGKKPRKEKVLDEQGNEIDNPITEEEIIEGEKEVEAELEEEAEADQGVIGKSQFPDGDEILSGQERDVRMRERARKEREDLQKRVQKDDDERLKKIADAKKLADTKAEAREGEVPQTGFVNPTTGEPIRPADAPIPANPDEAPRGTQDSILGAESVHP